MPAIDDYDKNEEQQGSAPDFSPSAPSGNAPVAPGTGSAVQAQSTPQKESTFTPWSRFVSANEDVSNREAGKLQSSVQNDVNAAGKARDDLASAQAAAIQSNYGNGTTSTDSAKASAKHDGPNGLSPYGPLGPTSGSQGQPTPQGGLTNEALNAPQGSKDLETQAGPEAWAKLLGQTKTAGDEASALGSTTGVQGLIQERSSQPLSGAFGAPGAFDAALESQAGGQGFQSLDKQYGNGQLLNQLGQADMAAQGRWQKLMGDVKAAKAAQQAAAGQPSAPSDVAASVDAAPGAKDVHDLLYGDGGGDFFSTMHQAGLEFSPADWAAYAAGEAGTDTPMPTEEYVKAATGALASQMQSSWPAGKFQMAWSRVAGQYSQEAIAALLSAFSADNKAMLKQYLSQMHNPGFMARNMRAWLQAHGYQPHGRVDQASQTRSLGQGTTYTDPSGHQRTTTDRQESERVIAYREGWGESWDEQFNNGIDEPTR